MTVDTDYTCSSGKYIFICYYDQCSDEKISAYFDNAVTRIMGKVIVTICVTGVQLTRASVRYQTFCCDIQNIFERVKIRSQAANKWL